MRSAAKFIVCALGAALAFSLVACTNDDPVPTETYTVQFEESRYLLAEGDVSNTATLSASVFQDGKSTELSAVYTVSDPTIATIDGATVTALKAGTATVTASYTPKGGTAVTAEAKLEVLGATAKSKVNAFSEEAVNLYGRTYFQNNNLVLDNVCTGLEIAFVGTELEVTFASGNGMIRTFLDGESEGTTSRIKSAGKVTVAEGLENGLHIARILKATSPQYGTLTLKSGVETDGSFFAAPEHPALKIEVVGDSITAGAGALGKSSDGGQTIENSDPTKAYAYLTAQTLDADFSIMAQEGYCVKDNPSIYDCYPHLSISNKADYDFSQFEADIVIVGLGENDMWHATSDKFPYTVAQFQDDYADLLRLIREKQPKAKIVCVYGMMPASDTAQAQTIITAAINATGDENITQLRMFKNEAGAQAHPSAEAHAKYASNLVKHIKNKVLK